MGERPAGSWRVRGGVAAYRRMLGAQVRSQRAYRTSFALDLLGNGLIPAMDLILIAALFRVTRSLAGFGVIQVLLMYGLAATAFAVADLAVGNIERVRVYVRLGLLDAVLLRPMSALGQLVALDFSVRRVARVMVASGILVVAAARAGVVWTPAHIALVLAAPLAGAVFYSAIFVAGATVAFWWIESGEFANAFTYGGRDFASYPITIYSGALRQVVAYALGLSFVAYYPALALLDRPDPLGLPGWVAWLGAPVAALAVAAAAVIWRSGIRHYRSTGS